MQTMFCVGACTYFLHAFEHITHKGNLWFAGTFDKGSSIPNDKSSWLKAWDITDKKIQDEMKLAIDKDDGIVGTYYKR
jgi:hypothetical protein